MDPSEDDSSAEAHLQQPTGEPLTGPEEEDDTLETTSSQSLAHAGIDDKAYAQKQNVTRLQRNVARMSLAYHQPSSSQDSDLRQQLQQKHLDDDARRDTGASSAPSLLSPDSFYGVDLRTPTLRELQTGLPPASELITHFSTGLVPTIPKHADLVTHSGLVWIQFAFDAPFTPCNAYLCGPLLQIFPRAFVIDAKKELKKLMEKGTAFGAAMSQAAKARLKQLQEAAQKQQAMIAARAAGQQQAAEEIEEPAFELDSTAAIQELESEEGREARGDTFEMPEWGDEDLEEVEAIMAGDLDVSGEPGFIKSKTLRETLTRRHKPFEIDLSRDVRVESVVEPITIDEHNTVLWMFLLHRTIIQDDGSELPVRLIIGASKKEELTRWIVELSRVVRSVENAVNMLETLGKRRLSQIVATQLANNQASGDDGMQHILQNVTQLQRNVALMSLRDGHERTQVTAENSDAAAVRYARVHATQKFLKQPLTTGGQRTFGGDDDMPLFDGDGGVEDQASYLRKHFVVKDRGNFFFFWGRLKIGSNTFARLGIILISYPFVVIYSVLELEQLVAAVARKERQVKLFGRIDVSRAFNNARRFVVAVNLVLLFVPIFLVHLVIGLSHDSIMGNEQGELHAGDQVERKNKQLQFLIIMVVAAYSLVYLSPVAIAIIEKVRHTTNQTDVVDGTFCFRPHYKLRLFADQPMTFNLNTANISTLAGIWFEFLQHSFYCLPKCQVSPSKCKINNFELPKENIVEIYFHIKWRYIFWLMFGCTLFNAGVFVTHGVLSGKKKYALSNHFWLWQVIWVLNGPAYVTITTVLFQAFSCRMIETETDKYEFRLVEDTDIRCWSAPHKNMAVAAFIGLAVYLTQAALLPSGTYKETMRNKLFDILYVPAYLEGHFFLKAIFAAVYVTFFGFNDVYRIPVLLLVNVMLLLLNMREQPCAVQDINFLRTATLSGTVWAGTASLLYVTQLQSDADDCKNVNKGFLAILFMTGWIMIFSGAAYIGKSSRKPIDAVLAHTFLELERQVHLAQQAGQSGPLVGLNNKILTIGGKEVAKMDALKNWESTKRALERELAKQAREYEMGQRQKQVKELTTEDMARIYEINTKVKLGTVAPRVLEPLISLTLSDELDELEHAAKYIKQLVWCTSIRYPRVQFQALWALANLAQSREFVDAEGVNIGDKYRQMIVSSDYIFEDTYQKVDGFDMEEEDDIRETFAPGGTGVKGRNIRSGSFLHSDIYRDSDFQPPPSSQRVSSKQEALDLRPSVSLINRRLRAISSAQEVPRGSLVIRRGSTSSSLRDVRDRSMSTTADSTRMSMESTNSTRQPRRSSTGYIPRGSSRTRDLHDSLLRDSTESSRLSEAVVVEDPNSLDYSEIYTGHASTGLRQRHSGPTDTENPIRSSILGKEETKTSTAKDEAEEPTDQIELPGEENSLGGLQVIFADFTNMVQTVKLEALALMVNLSLSDNVADNLTFHNNGFMLDHLLEMLWAPSAFTKFATLVIVNLAAVEKRRQVILERGGLAAVLGLLLASNYELQVAACRALANLALSPAEDVLLFQTDTFISRVLNKLAPVDHPETQEVVATLMRNLSIRSEFALALNRQQHQINEKLSKLRTDSKDDKVQKLIMYATNMLQETKNDPQRAAVWAAKQPAFESIRAEVKWDTWASKLDRIWVPVFAVVPVAYGRHYHVMAYPERHDVVLKADDVQGLPLKYRIVTLPANGMLARLEEFDDVGGTGMMSRRMTDREDAGISDVNNCFTYVPSPGFEGLDYFTFVASNGYLDSNLCTVSIRVDASLRLEKPRRELPTAGDEDDVDRRSKTPKRGMQMSKRINKSFMNLFEQIRAVKRDSTDENDGSTDYHSDDLELGDSSRTADGLPLGSHSVGHRGSLGTVSIDGVEMSGVGLAPQTPILEEDEEDDDDDDDDLVPQQGVRFSSPNINEDGNDEHGGVGRPLSMPQLFGRKPKQVPHGEAGVPLRDSRDFEQTDMSAVL